MKDLLKNKEPFLRVEQYLINEFKDPSKNHDWNPSKMKIMDSALYANKQVEFGGNTIDLLEGDSTQVRGITNFDGKALNKGRVFVADKIAFGWAESTPNTEVHAAEYSYSDLPKSLQHANLVLKQNDEVVIKLPLMDIVNSSGRGNNSHYRELGAFAFIADTQPVDLLIELPRGAKADELNEEEVFFFSVYIGGFETFVKR